MNHCLDRPALLFCACALAVLLGCAPPPIKHEYALPPDHVVPRANTTTLLIPINETEKPPTGLDIADHVLDDLVTQYLQSKGLDVERLENIPYRRALQAAVSAAEDKMQSRVSSPDGGTVSGTIAYADILPQLLAELDSDADLVVVTNVAMRTGEYSGGTMIRWDGVRRRERAGPNVSMTGDVPVASLHTVIFDKRGREVFSGYGGLDAIFETSIREKKYVLKEDLLSDEENLAEGVCVSFHPFFGVDERC